MTTTRPNRNGAHPWLVAALWTSAIYLAIPVARTIQHGVETYLGRSAFLYVVFTCLVLASIAVVRVVRREVRSRAWLSWACLIVVAILFAVGTWHLRANPEEAMHFVQYGVLSALIYRAFRSGRADAGIYLASFFLGTLIGVVDEVIQWIIPRRFFDFRDIGINVTAVTLVQIALAFGIRPHGVVSQPRAATLRVALRLATTLALLLTLLCSATPARVAALPRWMGLWRVDEPLIEYGHRLSGADNVFFYSRFTAEALLGQDQTRADEVGALLAQFAGDRGYERFLEQVPPTRDAFAHEMRVHLFRRDRYWALAENRQAEPITIAFREQQILERYFGQTLKASGLDWSPEQREEARAGAQAGPYVSPVSKHLITRLSERQLRMVPLLALVVFFLWVRYSERRENVMP